MKVSTRRSGEPRMKRANRMMGPSLNRVLMIAGVGVCVLGLHTLLSESDPYSDAVGSRELLTTKVQPSAPHPYLLALDTQVCFVLVL